MTNREIISFLLVGGNPDKYHSSFISACYRLKVTVGSPYRGGKGKLSSWFDLRQTKITSVEVFVIFT